MSWMKRRGLQSPSPANPGVQMYSPNQQQHSIPQRQWQQPQIPQQYPTNEWYSQNKKPEPRNEPQNAYWHQPPVQEGYHLNNQQTNQYQYNQYSTPPNSFYPNPNYPQQSVPAEQYQQNYYVQQGAPNVPCATEVYPQPDKAEDSDPWNWGWDDNSNTQATSNAHSHPKNANQNAISESFANDESWNWTVDDGGSGNPARSGYEQVQTQNVPQNNQVVPCVEGNIPAKGEMVVRTVDMKTEKPDGAGPLDNSTVEPPPQQSAVEQMPGLPSVRRVKEESLTPQWSIESQVSQDSSDDILLTSESENRSHILSRSSTISQSPSRSASAHDGLEYPQFKSEETNSHPVENTNELKARVPVKEEPVNSEYYQGNEPSDVHTVDRALQRLSLTTNFENKEILTPDLKQPPREEVKQALAPPPPPPKKPGPPPADTAGSSNPYKRSGSLSHRSASRLHKEVLGGPVLQDPEPFVQSAASAFVQPTPRSADSVLANLESPPENSERPDQLPAENIQKTVRKTSMQQQWPENCEVAPINDRNQYLETGQLSDDSYSQLPPPGLRRLVLGQLEQPEGGQPPFDSSSDEPPPGLSRMVPGRREAPQLLASPFLLNHSEYSNTEEPPAGLHRMIPGESSSPESSTYARFTGQPSVYQPANFDDLDNYVSESELNQLGVNLVAQRSATIGADTPPATQQAPSAGYSSSSSDLVISRVGAVGIDSESREADVEGANTLDQEQTAAASDGSRREDIDGGPQHEDKPTRDQTVGQNMTDLSSSSASIQEKRKPRNYQTDSDHEQPKDRHRAGSPDRYDKDWKYGRDYPRDSARDTARDNPRDRPKDRDSPDRYRDRKYDWRRSKDRYEDDTDYYSDKERERRHRDERDDYDRRFNSLRKDYDKRKDSRRDYSRGDRHEDYYYARYKEDYYGREPNRSRPSSRSDSMHDSYRERTHRPHDREHERPRQRDRDHRRPRDPYNQYYQGFNYDAYNPYYQQYHYQYYENLRRTNPQAYAEWYRKYYQSQNPAAQMGYAAEDRASVHSGRSSANEELNKDRYTRQSYYSNQSYPYYYREVQNTSTIYTVDDSRLLDQDSSVNLEDTNVISQRLTPAKFSTAHVKASVSSGQLVKILPHYPLDGQPASVEIAGIQNVLLDSEELRELSEFPGPLTKGVTHKKTVIDYCENKIKKVASTGGVQDVESYILMWELLILLLRQNGMVVGTDIAELLMKNRTANNSRRQSISSSSSAHLETTEHAELINRSSPGMQYKEDYVTDKFREYLIYGSGKEALEWAMKHGLWGHALFLASKLDKRTYANVMMRFANGLTMNDPLQTLYQLLSGRQPAAVTSVVDEKWGDWRPHLAMILSNTSQRPELDRKAIMTLGDTLSSRGSLYAAHFCYLMAQVEFGRYGSQDSKLVLLGSSHLKPFKVFASNEAIFMTEVYEYACSLNDSSFVIPEFQPYKYLVATRLADHGLLEKSLFYLERAAVGIKMNPSRIEASLISNVCQLADRLKYHDPMHVADDIDSDNRPDNSWLTDLRALLDNYNMGLISHKNITNVQTTETDLTEDSKTSYDQHQEKQWQEQSADYYQQANQQSWQSEQVTEYSQQSVSYDEGQQQIYESGNFQEQQYWNQNQQQNQPQQQYWEDNQENNTTDEQHSAYWNNAQNEKPAEPPNEPKTNEPVQPLISMPNQTQSKTVYDSLDGEDQPKPSTPAKPKSVPVQNKPTSTGWFGGIWSKLAPKPRNQMKLPDDKNPTIVWDPEKKRWVNLEADGDEASSEIKPPPKMSDMFPNKTLTPPSQPASLPNLNQTVPSVQKENLVPPNTINNTFVEKSETPDDLPKPSNQPNMFKLQRGRNLKKAYVDVFNPSGTKASNVPAPDMFNAPPPSSGAQMNYFVPAPVSDPNAPTDFLTPHQGPSEDNQQGNGGPAMYNPNLYSSQNVDRNINQ